MNKRELIEALSKFSDDTQVMILDGFNGGGTPREINISPHKVKIKKADADACADCEDLVGQSVIVIGYGCY